MAATILPLYFTSNSLAKSPRERNVQIKDIDVCNATVKVIPPQELKGVQVVGGLWRIYTNTVLARAKLAAAGIDIKQQHISLLTTNPFSVHAKNAERPIKITISDLPMHYDNECVESYLKGLGVKLVKQVEYVKIRDENNRETQFYSGQRVTYAEADYLRSNPLPQWMLMGSSVVKIRHYGQILKNEECQKCFSTLHPPWKCNKKQRCRVCRKDDQIHLEGTPECPHYVEESPVTPFGGRRDILSNFHPCKFTYQRYTYETREQAIQHQKALTCGLKMWLTK